MKNFIDILAIFTNDKLNEGCDSRKFNVKNTLRNKRKLKNI
tara:strand:+ start:397 stop:519 length:123 start_codon:yes stop_codon:yes gene_type:complete